MATADATLGSRRNWALEAIGSKKRRRPSRVFYGADYRAAQLGETGPPRSCFNVGVSRIR
jgi:hypothetical protein